MGRTTHRSTAGRKLYARRNKRGEFQDIQQYRRAHGQDVRRRSRDELEKKAERVLDAFDRLHLQVRQLWLAVLAKE